MSIMDTFDDALKQADIELAEGTEPSTDDNLTESETEPASELETTTEPFTEEVVEETTPQWWEDRLEDTVEVNGTEVSLKELRDGYLRQSDYTRKTQEVADVRKQAEWAARFQEMLRNDPVGTLRDMAVELRLISKDQPDFDPDDVDPNAVEIAGLRDEVQQLQLRRVEEEIRREVADVRSRYDDFDAEEVLPFIAEMGAKGVGLTIEEGYFLVKGRKGHEKAAAERAAAEKAAAQAEALAAKRKQAESVSRGHSAPASSDDDARYSGMSFEDIANEVFGTT
jgi:hypothetical protein